MILDNAKNGLVEVIGEDTTKTSTINLAKARKMQYILTEALYSDAESAVIVELSNNGVDAIVESGKDPIKHPVVVTLGSPSYGKYFLSIKDEGTGMNKEFFENFFMSLLDSTKEESNDFIGAWGLGGKSWNSLRRSVTFTIVKDGVKCKYLCWKGEEAIDYDLLSEETTTQSNGVLFEMPINDYQEYSRFQRKAKEKLAYYDTVVLIIDGKIWQNNIYRNDLFQYTLNPPFGDMHMCLKDVVYDIDYSKLGIPKIALPIAIRIGLEDGIYPTPSREKIMYNKESMALIKNKIGEVCRFFEGKWAEKIKEPISFWDNFKMINTSSKYVDLKDKVFEVSCLEQQGAIFSDYTCAGMTYKSPSWYKSNMHDLMSFLYIKAEYKYNKVWKTKRIWDNLPNSYENKKKVILVDGELRGNIKEYIKETCGVGNTFVSLSITKTLHWYIRNVVGKAPKSQWRDIIKEYQGVQSQIIKDFCDDRRGVENTPSYIDWLEKRREWAKQNNVHIPGTHKILNKQEGEVTIAHPRDSLIGNTKVFEKSTYKIVDLVTTPNLVIVFSEEDKEMAKKIAGIVKKEKVAIIGEREFRKIKNLHQFKYWNNMIEEGNKPFRRIATAILANRVLDKYDRSIGIKNKIVENCLQHVKDDIDTLKKYINENTEIGDEEVENAIVDLASSHNFWDGEFKPIINKVEKSIETFNFIQYMSNPHSWELSKIEEINRVIHQMLLFRKKYYKELEHYDLVYNPPMPDPEESEVGENNILQEYIEDSEVLEEITEEELELQTV